MTEPPSLHAERNTARRYGSLQAGRGLAALLVVAHHASTFLTDDPSLWHRATPITWLVAPKLRVAFFFVLSGIVILTAHWRDLGHRSTVLTFLWKRFRRIYPLYWLVLALVLCGQFLRLPAGSHNPWVILSSTLLVHIRTQAAILAPSWTLFPEVIFYGFFVTLLVHKRFGAVMMTLWLAMSSVRLFTGLPVLINLLSPLHLLFGLGMAAAWLIRERRVPQPAAVCVLGCLLFFGSLVWSGWTGQTAMSMFLWAGLGSALALMGAAELEMRWNFRMPAWLLFLGNASYAIYLIHFPVVSTVGRLGYRVDPSGRVPLLLWMSLMIAVGVAAGCILHILVERPLLRWLGKLHWPAVPTAETPVPAKSSPESA